MEDERPRDVRDSLSELEQRLLALERELRSDSVRDAGTARQSASASSSPGSATGRIEVQREPATATVGDSAPGATQPRQPQHFFGPPAGPSAAPAGSPPPAPPTPPDVGPLVDETRRKVEALRTSLDGLTGASDRLREVAQVVVEDHGRALVRLERATAQQYARAGDPAATERSAPIAAKAPVHDRRVRDQVPVPREPDGAAVEAGSAPHDPSPERREPEPPAPEPREPEPDLREPESQPEPAEPRTHWLAADDGGRQRRKYASIATLLVAGVVVAALVLSDGDEPATTTPTVPGSTSRIALTPELGPDTRAFASVPGTRPASDSGAIDDLCDGVVGAAVVVRASGSDPVPPCAGVVTVASGTVSALALAERRDGRRRTCVNAGDVPSIAASRADRRLTTARDRAVQRATTAAERLNRSAPLTAGERAGRTHTAAYAAGRRFDERRGLRLLAVRSGAQGACIVPGRDDVASGRYPLSSRVELLAMRSSLDQPAVDRAAAVIGHLTSGPAPISATVLERAG